MALSDDYLCFAGKIKMCEKRLMQELAKRADSKILKNIVWDSITCTNGCSETLKENGSSNGYKNGTKLICLIL